MGVISLVTLRLIGNKYFLILTGLLIITICSQKGLLDANLDTTYGI